MYTGDRSTSSQGRQRYFIDIRNYWTFKVFVSNNNYNYNHGQLTQRSHYKS